MWDELAEFTRWRGGKPSGVARLLLTLLMAPFLILLVYDMGVLNGGGGFIWIMLEVIAAIPPIATVLVARLIVDGRTASPPRLRRRIR